MGSKNWHLDLAKGKSVNDLDKNGVMVAKKKKKSPSEVNPRKNSWRTGDSKYRLWKSFAVKGNRKAEEEGEYGVEKFCVLGMFWVFMEMFVDTHCICISLYAKIQRAKAGHGWVSLLISLFKNLVSDCTKKKGKNPKPYKETDAVSPDSQPRSRF